MAMRPVRRRRLPPVSPLALLLGLTNLLISEPRLA